MNLRTCIATMVFAAAGPLAAQEAVPSLPAVEVQAVLQVVDCQHRALPTQRQVGEWTGQHNFSQVYATRERLMGEIGRTCNKPGIERVQLVQAYSPIEGKADGRAVAIVQPRE